MDHLEKILRPEKTENLFVFAIDNSFKLIEKRRYSMEKVREVGITPLELYSFINSTKPSYLAVAHNHPNSTAWSSPDDKGAYGYIEKLIENLSCKLVDSFVVGDDGIYSEKHSGFVRKFADVDLLVDVLNTQSDQK